MRVLHIMAGAGFGGAETYSTDVMLSLHQAGLDQCVAMQEKAPRTAELRRAGLRIDTKVLRVPFHPWRQWQMRRLITREKPDIVHCWMRRAASLVPKTAAGYPEPTPVIGWYGDYEEYKHFAHCTHFVGVTKDIVSYMIGSGVAEDRAFYIPTFPSVAPMEAIDRATLDTPKDAKVLLALSRLHPVKGLDTLMQAVVDMPECVLWLAGEGPAREDLQNLAQKLGIAARVKFLGWRTDRGALLKAADICVLPSRYEPFGTVILEAWESRVPFIACASDGPRAHIRHGENGMITPIDDAAALGHAIKQVLQNKDLRDRIVAQGYAEYQADFTREAVTRQWMGFYKKIQAP